MLLDRDYQNRGFVGFETKKLEVTDGVGITPGKYMIQGLKLNDTTTDSGSKYECSGKK